jgi:hypothetical protein
MTRDQAIENAEKSLEEIRVMESAAHGLSLAKIAMKEAGNTDVSVVESSLNDLEALIREKISESNGLFEVILTSSQKSAIAQIKNNMLRDPSYEIKYFHLATIGRAKVSLVVEVGKVNDEGTYGSIFCRNRRHYCIGARGGLTLFKNGKKVKGRKALCGVFL